MVTITKGQALEALTEAVKEKGAAYTYHRVSNSDGYPTCLYTDTNSRPSCIVGHALANLGVPFDVLHAIDWGGAVVLTNYDENDLYLDEPVDIILPDGEGLGDTSIDDSPVLDWLARNEFYLDAGTIDLFSRAQQAQDDGDTWGEAVSMAIAQTGSHVK